MTSPVTLSRLHTTFQGLERIAPVEVDTVIVHGPGIKQQAAIPFFGHTEILHMLVSLGSTALAAAVVLPRYGGLNYACGINAD